MPSKKYQKEGWKCPRCKRLRMEIVLSIDGICGRCYHKASGSEIINVGQVKQDYYEAKSFAPEPVNLHNIKVLGDL